MSVMNSYFIYQSISANFRQTLEAADHLFQTKKARKPAQHTLATSIPPRTILFRANRDAPSLALTQIASTHPRVQTKYHKGFRRG
jgi:hypothetical protein